MSGECLIRHQGEAGPDAHGCADRKLAAATVGAPGARAPGRQWIADSAPKGFAGRAGERVCSVPGRPQTPAIRRAFPLAGQLARRPGGPGSGCIRRASMGCVAAGWPQGPPQGHECARVSNQPRHQQRSHPPAGQSASGTFANIFPPAARPGQRREALECRLEPPPSATPPPGGLIPPVVFGHRHDPTDVFRARSCVAGQTGRPPVDRGRRRGSRCGVPFRTRTVDVSPVGRSPECGNREKCSHPPGMRHGERERDCRKQKFPSRLVGGRRLLGSVAMI